MAHTLQFGSSPERRTRRSDGAAWMEETKMMWNRNSDAEPARGGVRAGRLNRARRGQAGFSLIVVFSLVAIMAAVAAAVLLTSRTDVKVSGRQREGTVAFFTAEAGVAYAKSYLVTKWSPTLFWTSVLSEGSKTGSYDFGGVDMGGKRLPLLRARYTYSFSNNPDDPSGSATVDGDGRVVITSTGVALDAAGNTALSTSTVQVEVSYGAPSTLKGNYQAMQGQSASGASSSKDIQPVDMTKSSKL